MIFGPKRGHVLYIFDNALKDFGLLALALIFGFVRGNVIETFTSYGVILLIVLIAPLTRIISYVTMTLEVTPEYVRVKRGWLKKIQKEIPTSTITTVDFSQNIIQQFFGVYKMKIDNASNMAAENSADVRMLFSKEDAATISSILGHKAQGLNGANMIEAHTGKETAENFEVKIPASKLLLMGLLKSKTSLIVEGGGLAFVAIGYGSELVMGKEIEKLGAVSEVMIIVLGILFFLALGIAKTLITYFDFTLENKGEDIGVRYGFFTKKSFAITKSRISGFTYEQPFFMRLFGLGTLKVFAIGFGHDEEDKSENGVIHPLLKEIEVQAFMTRFIEEMDGGYVHHMPPRGSTRYFFYRAGVVFGMFFLLGSIAAAVQMGVYWLVAVAATLLALIIIGRILESGHCCAGGNERSITLVRGGFKKITTYVKTDQVEAVATKGSVWKRKKNIADIQVDFLGHVGETTAMVYNLDVEVAVKLEKLMMY